jgi:succinyl-CoA synthetase beta subunit
MKIHEYQAKKILDDHGVAVPVGAAADTVDEAVNAAENMKENGSTLFVVKAQIHAGGRGKGETKNSGASGVHLCNTIDEVRDAAESLLGDVLVTKQTGDEGQKVQKVYVTDGVDIEEEFYLGILLVRAKSKNVLMVSTEGGMDIEQVAEESPDKIVKEWVEPGMDLQHNQARHLAYELGIEGDAF